MRRAFALSLIALLLPISGCLTDSSDDGDEPPTNPSQWEPLTEDQYGPGEFTTYRLESFDGTMLHVDVQFPDGDGPWPLIIEYTPYTDMGTSNANAFRLDNEEPFDEDVWLSGTASRYVPKGYAVATAHVRGTGESEGCLTVGGPEEGLDGVEIVEQLAAMEWSTGKVAMTGASYVGTTPMETAIHNPPHLTTIVPVAAVTDWYRYYYENGIHRISDDLPPGSDFTDPVFWNGLGTLPGWRTGTVEPTETACTIDFTANYWGNDDRTDFWQDRDHGTKAHEAQAPMLFTHGWDDPNVPTSMIPKWWYEYGGEKRAWLGQHGHSYSNSEHYRDYEHRWFDHYLLGRDNGVLELPTAIIQTSNGTYRAEDAWPPMDATNTTWWLGPDGLTDTAPTDATASWTDYGPGAPEDAPNSELIFATAPFNQDMVMVGEPVMHLVASSNLPDTQFGARIFAVAPNGTEAFITRGYLDARHWDSLESGSDLTPGTTYDFHWLLHPQDFVIPADHHVKLVLDSGDAYVVPEQMRATNTAHYGAEGSWIQITTVPASTRSFHETAGPIHPDLFPAKEGA